MTSKPEGARILIVEDHERDMGIASEVALAAGAPVPRRPFFGLCLMAQLTLRDRQRLICCKEFSPSGQTSFPPDLPEDIGLSCS